MAIRFYKPTSPGRRGMSTQDFGEITKSEPEKSLLEHKVQKVGRNNHGRITSRFRSAGHKKRYRKIDFKRNKTGVPAKVLGIEYDPNRTARIALIQYTDGEKAYILAPQRSRLATEVIAANSADIKPGNCLPLRFIPVGTDSTLSSSRWPWRANRALGWRESHADGEGRRLGHAAHAFGRNAPRPHRVPRDDRRHRQHRARQHPVGQGWPQRWLGIRPHKRGVSMNPVDHPMGGGEGRSSGGRHPCTPWGVKTKGLKTRHNKRTEQFIIRRRSK